MGEVAYTVDAVTGCWNWNGSVRKDGYGRQWFEGKAQLAHRVSFFRAFGYMPTEIDHECGNRRCINPEHLKDTTHMENVRRSSKTKLTQEQVDEIRKEFAAGNRQCELSRKWGVGSSQIHRIVHNENWQLSA